MTELVPEPQAPLAAGVSDVANHYPPHWEADVVVADGGTVRLRPIVPADAPALVAFHAGLSSRTRYLRYFSAYPTIPERDLRRFTTHDHVNRVALAVWLSGRMIGVGRFDRLPAHGAAPTPAEVAFVVADAHQGRGIGSVLLEHLVEVAREVKVETFIAMVLAENTSMLRVFLDAGFHPSQHYEGSEVTLEFEVAATAQTERVISEREQSAESRSIRRLLFPSSVAVIGASTDESKIGNLVFTNLLRFGFTGPVYPVNSRSRSINGVLAYPAVSDIDGQVDLAVVSVPASEVLQVLPQCAERGVRALVVVSAGFGEGGDEPAREQGLRAQQDLVGRARIDGMRVVGPHCLGIINTDPDVRLNASLSTVTPLSGRAGFFCQSGALGAAVLGEARRRGLGISTFVSAGNRADVSGNDLLQYWESDPATDIALLYLESFGNPRKFARIARRFARHKPIVALKSGRGTLLGANAAAGAGAGADPAGAGSGADPARVGSGGPDIPETSVQTLFEASGVIRTDTLAQMFDVAALLATQPLPRGEQVAVVGHSSALGVLVTDALSLSDLELARVVEVGIDASPADFGNTLAQVLAAPDVDAVITIFVPPIRRGEEDEVAREIRDAALNQSGGTAGSTLAAGGAPADSLDKPVLSVFLGFDGIPQALSVPGTTSPMQGSVPSYASPERAVAALDLVSRYARWRHREPGRVPALAGIEALAAAAAVDTILAQTPSGRELTAAEARHLLGCYGIEVVAALPVMGIEAALQGAAELGVPVALQSGGMVRLHLADADAVAAAWHSLQLGPGNSAILQPMAPRGVDTVLRVLQDRSFGSLLSFGVGGVATDLLDDRSYAVVPLTTLDAGELIGGPKAFALLTGYGGAEPADIGALIEVALRLSALAEDLPQIAECTLDPLVASPVGAHVLSALVRVAPSSAPSGLGARRLRGL